MMRITCTVPEDHYTFFIIPRSVLLRMRNVEDKSCRENRKTHFKFNLFFFFENRAVYYLMWENNV